MFNKVTQVIKKGATLGMVSAALMVCTPANAATLSKSAQLEKYFSHCHQANVCNGSFLIAENGEVLYSDALGITDEKGDKQLSTKSAFDIGSVTKQFTAMLIMQLKEQGALNYDDKLIKYLPTLPYKKITIRQLLTHTSGIPEVMKFFTKQFRAGKVNSSINNASVVKVLATENLKEHFEAGEKWEYSNTGYALLASIVEILTKQTFTEALESRIFTPLAMENSTVYQENFTLENRAYGFLPVVNGQHRKYDQIPFYAILGGGGIYSTTLDLYKWEQAITQNTLISHDSWQEAITPITLNNGDNYPYGFGWSLKNTADGSVRQGHGGHWRGFRSAIERYPNQKQTVIFLNNNAVDDSVDENVATVKAILDGKAYRNVKTPIEWELIQILEGEGVSSAHSFFNSTLSSNTESYDISESALNDLGYSLLAQKQNDLALAVFQMNSKAHPKSINALDSLADGYLAKNNIQKAISSLTQALIITPNETAIKARIAQLTH